MAPALLLGTRLDLAREVDRVRREEFSGPIADGELIMYASYMNGTWDFSGILEHRRSAERETHEGFVYFSRPDDETEMPTEPLTVLWYGTAIWGGSGWAEFPIELDRGG